MKSLRSLAILTISIFLLWGSIFLFSSNLKEQSTEKSETIPSILFSQCGFHQEADIYRVDASCALQGNLPKLETKEVVDLLRPEIIGRSEMYLPFETTYRYYGSTPLFATEISGILDGSITSQQELATLAKQGKVTQNMRGDVGNYSEISFTKKELAHYRINQLAFYVSEKDISRLSRCNTQNYSLALQRIDGYLLKPGESFNANRELAKVRGYCTGRGGKDYLFYGGVCGMTAQVFRTTLIHPNIEIVKRRPHNEWFVQYYGEDIGGDDAAIYEMSKQFEVKNTGTEDIYFKVKWLEGNTQLVAVSPRNTQRVEITKHPINALNINLERTIRAEEKSEEKNLIPLLPFSELPTKETEQIIKTETFPSTYIKKNYETR